MLPRRSWHRSDVPRFEPFAALRYDPARVDLGAVVAPPYDVLSDDERARFANRHERNIVHIDVPLDADGAGRYEAAAATFASWRAEGTLVEDPAPSFTLYRMSFVDHAGRRRSTVGVVGALEVVDEGAGGVLPHERTTPKAATDRLELTRATRANLSPIWGLSLASGLTGLLAEPGESLGSSIDDDGVTHSVERVQDPDRTAAIRDAVAGAPVLIADGHHRYAVSRIYRDEQRAAHHDTARPAFEGALRPYDLTLAYVGELVADQLSVEPVHRMLDGLPAGRTWSEVVEPYFESEPYGAADPTLPALLVATGALALVDADRTAVLLHPRPEAFEGVRDLDSARLERVLAGVPHRVSFQHGLENVLASLAKGESQAAVLTRPVSVAEIERTAHEGLLMPPKSTFFAPKLRTGLVLRSLA
jgi:uncharacterized protein (DUF1015 family)